MSADTRPLIKPSRSNGRTASKSLFGPMTWRPAGRKSQPRLGTNDSNRLGRPPLATAGFTEVVTRGLLGRRDEARKYADRLLRRSRRQHRSLQAADEKRLFHRNP